MPPPLTYDAPIAGRWTDRPSFGIVSLRDATVGQRVGQWPDVIERTPEIIRPQDRCGTDDSASRHCWSPPGAAGLDVFLDANDPAEREQGWRLARRYVANAAKLGVQGVNYNGWRWGFGRWYWRRIPADEHQHDDHVHVELNDHGAAHLTEPTARLLLRAVDGASADPYTEEEGDEQVELQRGTGMNTVWVVPQHRGFRRHVVNNGVDQPACEVAQGHNGVKEVDPKALAPIPILGKPPETAEPKYQPVP